MREREKPAANWRWAASWPKYLFLKGFSLRAGGTSCLSSCASASLQYQNRTRWSFTTVFGPRLIFAHVSSPGGQSVRNGSFYDHNGLPGVFGGFSKLLTDGHTDIWTDERTHRTSPAGNTMRLAGWNRRFRRFHVNADGRTHGRTDGHTDTRTDGQTFTFKWQWIVHAFSGLLSKG